VRALESGDEIRGDVIKVVERRCGGCDRQTRSSLSGGRRRNVNTRHTCTRTAVIVGVTAVVHGDDTKYRERKTHKKG